MDINKRSRGELKSYFVTNAVPTESNFAELIDAGLNQREDGIAKQPGSPLCIEAAGDETSQKKVLNLYEAFLDESPAWTLSLRPRMNPADPLSVKKGLSIGDSGGASRLFIDRVSGNVGIATVDPKARLDVAGDARVAGKLRVAGGIEAADAGGTLKIDGNVLFTGAVTAQNFQLTSQIPQADWKPLELTSKWVRYDAAHATLEYYKDSLGRVHLRGVIKGGYMGGAIFAVLPEGCRPEYSSQISVVLYSGVAGRIDVSPNGELKAYDMDPSWTSLDGVSFRAHH